MKKLIFILIFLNISLWAQSWRSSYSIPAPSNGIQNAVIYNDTLIVPWNLANNVLQRLKISDLTWSPYTDSVNLYNPVPVTFLLAQVTDTLNIFYLGWQGGYTNSYGIKRINVNTGYTQSLNAPFGAGDGYGRGLLIAERQDTLWTCTEGIIQKFDLTSNTWTRTDTLPHFAVWMQTIAGQVYVMSGNYGWSYWGDGLQGSDSTVSGYLYKIDSNGRKVQLAKIGNVINWATQFDYRVTTTDTLIYINGWGYSTSSQYGLYEYSTHNNTMSYLGHPAQLTSNAQNIRSGGVAVDTLHKIIYTAYGNPTNSCTDSTNTIWAYSYINSSWRKLPFIVAPGCPYQGATQLYYVTDTLIGSSSTITYNSSYNVNGDQTFNAIKDTVYDAIAILVPNAGNIYNNGDTVNIGWIDNYAIKKFHVYYRNSSDSSWSLLDSTTNEYYDWVIPSYVNASQWVQFLVSGDDSTASAISNTVSIFPVKYISISNVYITSGINPTINIVAIIGNIDSVYAYYSADSVHWNYYDEFTISNLNYHTDTLSSVVNFYINGISSYFKLIEAKDTTIYGFTTPIVGQFGWVQNPQICLHTFYNGDNGNWIIDFGCLWTSSPVQYGISTFGINANGTSNMSYTITTIPFHTWYDNPNFLINNNTWAQGNFIYNGRTYFITEVATQWYPIFYMNMTDNVNNISYSTGIVAQGSAGFADLPRFPSWKVFGNYIVCRAGWTGFSFKALPYPANPANPITSIYHLTGQNIFSNYGNNFHFLKPRF